MVGINLGVGAGTEVSRVAKVAAGAGVHGGNQHKIGWISNFMIGARDGDLAVFKGLAEGFEQRTRILREFVEEEDAAVGKGNLSWLSFGAAADQGSETAGMMRGAEGTVYDNIGGGASEGMELSDGNLFRCIKRRKKTERGFCEHGFAGSGRAGK